MVLTLKEHLDTLESRNHINRQAAMAVLATAAGKAGVDDVDPERLESMQAAVMVDAMAVAHQEYHRFYPLYSREEPAGAGEIKDLVRTAVYPVAESVLDARYLPKSSMESWVHVIATYLDTYYQVLTGARPKAGLSALRPDAIQ